MKMFRQGDVLIKQIKRVSAALQDVTPDGRIVLAHGEVTGHAHAIAPGEAREFSMADASGVVSRFLAVVSEAVVTHEEHEAIALPKGFYQIIVQKEYSPESNHNVAD